MSNQPEREMEDFIKKLLSASQQSYPANVLKYPIPPIKKLARIPKRIRNMQCCWPLTLIDAPGAKP